MGIELSRKEFIRASIFGAAGVLLLSPATAIAGESPESIDVQIYMPDVPKSVDRTINIENQAELDKWEATMKKAFARDDDINMSQSNHEPATSDYRCALMTKEVALYNIPCEISLDAVFDVLTDGTIGEVYRVDAGAVKWGPDVKLIQSSWVKEDHGKKLAALYIVDVTWDAGIYPRRTETYAFYREFTA